VLGSGTICKHDKFRGPQRPVLHKCHRVKCFILTRFLPMKTNQGYSLVEVVAVLILLFILMAAGIWSFGNSRNLELFGKISQDLARIDSAKSSWRTDHPEDAFPSDEPDRFTVLQPYFKSGLTQVDTLANWQPANVNYFIND